MLAVSARNTAAWPAELPPPTTATSSPAHSCDSIREARYERDVGQRESTADEHGREGHHDTTCDPSFSRHTVASFRVPRIGSFRQPAFANRSHERSGDRTSPVARTHPLHTSLMPRARMEAPAPRQRRGVDTIRDDGAAERGYGDRSFEQFSDQPPA